MPSFIALSRLQKSSLLPHRPASRQKCEGKAQSGTGTFHQRGFSLTSWAKRHLPLRPEQLRPCCFLFVVISDFGDQPSAAIALILGLLSAYRYDVEL
jgi:hypothetical protein